MQKQILVIEDEIDILDMITLSLSREGYQVVTCTSVAQGLQQIANRIPHLMLTDKRLPDADGNELICQLRSRETTRSMPMVLMTAAVGLEELAKSNVADKLLLKPFALRELCDVVGALLSDTPDTRIPIAAVS